MVENVIWPAYLDADLTRSEGRRVPEDLAVPDPDVEEIAEAVKQVGYDAMIEPDLAYPRNHRKNTGRVAVENADEDGKSDLLQGVAAYVKILRE